MIRKILTTYATSLAEFLSRFPNKPKGLAKVVQIGNSTEEKPNKMETCLLSVERNTTGGIATPVQRTEKRYAWM